MKIEKLTIFEFDDFSKKHPLGSYHQTSNFGIYASEQGYDYDLLGCKDSNGNIICASLILSKKIGLFYKYGYAPKGFLIDYYNKDLLKDFTESLKKYLYKKNYAFVKINPEITVGITDPTTHITTYNNNLQIKDILRELKYRELIDDTQFGNKLPKYNATSILKKITLKNIKKPTRNKINKSIKLGLELELSNRDGIDILYKFIKNKKKYPINYYNNYYNAFIKNNSIDVFLIKINYIESLTNIKKEYERELEHNAKLVEKTMNKPTETNLKQKLDSDAILNSYKNNIAELTKYLQNNETCYIGGAITIKYKNRVNIIISGFDNHYKSYAPNHFLHYKLIEYYKNDYDYMDLNGISGNYTQDNKYKGLDEFKFGFNPLLTENIGEYDLIVNEGLYTSLEKNGLLAKEFNKKNKNIK